MMMMLMMTLLTCLLKFALPIYETPSGNGELP